MARIEKTVFISYRRTDVYTALAVYENLKNQGYDVFFDYRSISSGDFEQIITSNIRARAHFLLILTPTALDRCNEPGDWLRREIEFAIDERRNIVPLFFKGFRFAAPVTSEKSKWLRFGRVAALTGKLKDLSRYNGLNVHEDYFEEAMHRLRSEFLNKPLDTVLHPVSTKVRKVVQEEKLAADEALEKIENVQALVKQVAEKPELQHEVPDSSRALDLLQSSEEIADQKSQDAAARPKSAKLKAGTTFVEKARKSIVDAAPNFRFIGGFAGIVLLLVFLVWSSTWNIFQNQLTSTSSPTHGLMAPASQLTMSYTPSPTKVSFSPTTALTVPPTKTNTPIAAHTSISTSTMVFNIGSAITGKDGMKLLYVPAGEFIMGSDDGSDDEKPVHTVYLDAFWIDQTEVTNAMYAKCVQQGDCTQPSNLAYYSDSKYASHPVVYVSWEAAKAYCTWADRRLPTEAEWEKAARGDDERTYPWGAEPPKNNLLNYNRAIGETSEVGKYADGASPYGVLDMAGNVWEWVADFYKENYEAIGIPLDRGGLKHVLRGGSWSNHDYDIRAANRFGAIASLTGNNIGFRCAMSANP